MNLLWNFTAGMRSSYLDVNHYTIREDQKFSAFLADSSEYLKTLISTCVLTEAIEDKVSNIWFSVCHYQGQHFIGQFFICMNVQLMLTVHLRILVEGTEENNMFHSNGSWMT